MSKPPFVRVLDPPRRVWVHVGRLLPLGRDDLDPAERAALNTQGEVAGMLREWVPTSDGGRLGLVTYQLLTRDEKWSVDVTHYVPMHMLRPRGVHRAGRASSRKPRTHG